MDERELFAQLNSHDFYPDWVDSRALCILRQPFWIFGYDTSYDSERCGLTVVLKDRNLTGIVNRHLGTKKDLYLFLSFSFRVLFHP